MAKKQRSDSLPDSAVPFDPTQPTKGCFWPDGSWNHDGDTPPKAPPTESLYWFVDMLVTKRRRSPDAPPFEFAARIARSGFLGAFPSVLPSESRMDWSLQTVEGKNGQKVAAPWWSVGSRTSAEAAVKFGGHPNPTREYPQAVELFEAEAALRTDLDSTKDLDEIIAKIMGVKV